MKIEKLGVEKISRSNNKTHRTKISRSKKQTQGAEKISQKYNCKQEIGYYFEKTYSDFF